MKTRLFFLSLIASLLFLSCDKDNDNPGNLPQTEAELKSAIQQKWDIGTANSDYKSITFKSDNTYNVLTRKEEDITGEYTIEKDLRTLCLTNFGKIELTTLTSDRLKFKLTLDGVDNNMDIDCTPASVPSDKALISEIQIEVDGKYLPEKQFIYNNGILREVLVTTYYNSSTTEYFQNKYVFEVNTENKITAANRYVKPHNINDWTLTGKYELIYQNGNISRIKDFDLGFNTYTTYDYTWKAGKIIKMKKEGETEIEFTYTNGNYLGDEDSGIEIDDEKYKDITNKEVNEFDATQKNWCEYLPVEYTILSDPKELKMLIPFSDNNVSETTYYTLVGVKNKNTNKKIYTLEYDYIMSYEYVYKNGLTESFTETITENYKYTDYIEPSKSEEKIKGPDTKKYKIKYIEIE